MRSLLTILACATLLSACHKSKNSNSLVGKWKVIATCRMGQIDWTTVNSMEAAMLTFNNDNTYISAPPPVSSMSACSGTYRIANTNTVMLATQCQLNPSFEEEVGFTISGNILTLDYRMSATGIRIRYQRQ